MNGEKGSKFGPKPDELREILKLFSPHPVNSDMSKRLKESWLILLGLTGLVNTSPAQIGWTLERCDQHYGKPVSEPNKNIDPGVTQYHFVSGKLDLYVRISTKTHLATAVYYSKVDRGPFSMAEIKQLLRENGPDLNWSTYQEEHPARPDDKSWIGQKGDETDLQATYSHLEEGEGYILNIFVVGS
jgi:hypothetical protein